MGGVAGLVVRWTYSQLNVCGPPALGTRGEVYVLTGSALVALNGTDGSVRWNFTALGPGIACSPMVIAFDGTVLFKNDYENAVYAVTRDGALRWKYKFPVPQQVIPVLDGAGTLFTGGFDGRLFATNSVTGVAKWSIVTGSAYGSRPAVSADGTTLYVGGTDNTRGSLYALSASSGALKWKYTPAPIQEVAYPPAVSPVDGSIIFVGSMGTYAVTPAGALKWFRVMPTTSVAVDIEGGPAVSMNGTVYVKTNDERLFCLDGATGTVKWTITTGLAQGSAPVLDSAGVLYLGVNGSRIMAVPPSGANVTTFTLPVVGAFPNGDLPHTIVVGPNNTLLVSNWPALHALGSPDVPPLL